MNRFARNSTVKVLALLAAVALAIAPVDLLASCGCSDCSCAAAVEDASDCCCTGAAHSAERCCEPAAAPATDGCTCSQAIPAAPVGTLTIVDRGDSLQSTATLVAALPLATEIDAGLPQANFWDQRLLPVPARVLFCVWRI